MDEIKDLHREQHHKGIAMYQAGVTCGIRFVIDRLLARFDDDIRTRVVDMLLQEYNE